MKFSITLAVIAALAIGSIFFMRNEQTVAVAAANPLTEKWIGPYGGLPPFDKVKIADFKPALEAAMEENLREIDAIANQVAPPSFSNTILALETTGQTLARVNVIYGIWGGNMNNDEFSKVETEMDPKLAGHFDKITQNEKLFKRIDDLYTKTLDKKTPPSEAKRLTWLYYTNFTRAGAKLGEVQKKRMSEINQALAGHFTKFNQNLLGDETQVFMTLDSEADLAGLPDGQKGAAA